MASKFGKDFNKVWPNKQPELTNFGRKLLNECQKVEKPKPLDINAIKKNSKEFPLKFPIETCRIYKQPQGRKSAIQEEIASVYPVLNERVVLLYLRFLEHKVQYGSQIEKEIYSNTSLTGFVQRLLSKRCPTFYSRNDKYMLITGERGASGFAEIGSDKEKLPLLLKNCLSYDEIKLSALLSVSSYTEFINDGTRENLGIIENDKSKIEKSGIIIGIIGARLSRRDFMEFQDIVISKTQNTTEMGYGIKKPAGSNQQIEKNFDFRQIWNEFYDEKGILFSNIKKDNERFRDCSNNDDIFDNVLMKKRYTISFDTLLLESEARAAAANKQAYIHVVGIGLGVWRTAEQQEAIFLETFSERIKVLINQLKHVSCIHFSWFNLPEWGDIKNGKCFKSKEHLNGGINILISNRNPAEKLMSPEYDNCVLIVSYPWDGNALPGNEFWVGLIASSGDSAAASSTLITELHNPHINTTMVSGENLHVASPTLGVVHIAEYAKQYLRKSTSPSLY